MAEHKVFNHVQVGSRLARMWRVRNGVQGLRGRRRAGRRRVVEMALEHGNSLLALLGEVLVHFILFGLLLLIQLRSHGRHHVRSLIHCTSRRGFAGKVVDHESFGSSLFLQQMRFECTGNGLQIKCARVFCGHFTRSLGSDVPRAFGAAGDEQDIVEMMERRGKAEAAAVAADRDDGTHKTDDADSGRTEAVSTANASVGAEGTTAAAADAAAAKADGSSEGSASGSEDEESEGSWTGDDEEGGDSDIEEFYLKGGEGQMDEVEKKKKAAAEQKIVMVRMISPMFSSNYHTFELPHRRRVLMFPFRCNSRRSGR